jgi:hypothetical protein
MRFLRGIDMLTKAMKERAELLNAEWKDEGDGYFSLIGELHISFCGSHALAYIALPKGHPCIGKPYDDFSVDVNGGLTFGERNVFGWDYGHAYNDFDIPQHIANALSFFKEFTKEVKP